MNKLEKMIKSLEENYKVNIEILMKDYEARESVEVMAQNQSVNPYVLRTVLQHLQLKRPKNKRDSCIKEFNAMLKGESIDEYTTQLEEENLILIEKIESLETSLIRSRDSLNLKRKQQRDTTRQSALADELLEVFRETLDDRPVNIIKPQFNKVQPQSETDEGLCIVLSDHHIGEVVGNDVVQNKYNYDIAIKRLDVFLDNVLAFPKQSRKLSVMQCGDNLKGIIHGGMFSSETSFIDSVIKAVDYNVYLYGVLASIYDEVVVYSITGNHDRITDEPAISAKALDFTRLIDTFVARQLSAKGIKNLKFLVTETPYQLIKINNSSTLMFHGDTVRKYSPADANQRSLLQDLCLGTFKEPYRHAVSGHTHQFIASHNQYDGMSITNGTLVGSNNFGVSNGMRDICASQTIFYINTQGCIEFIQAVKL